ncbi:MAG: GNAT family N-acetyltransferase [Candidatus Cloacimonetes bacterium]|nr:GNAT family N-acetyltransferase [Candidatus Cloacimonadota bacterium]MCF7812858.1 GNAT family N-acetyltransferase [Candidatus Cloacimonadota bacterium]MCF7867070.1 GNAT family N-acetyltransferase [Candidatus Cloacimonadota bacterium]MCF7882610.1 GNAT family N-acetyltransferase [Candidatus Cloacimonadota bacterium]
MKIDINPASRKRYDALFELMFSETGTYLERSLDLLKMNKAQFKEVFDNTGKKYEIFFDDKFAGFFWIENRNDTTHIHALIIFKKFRRKGIGNYV